MGGDVDGLYRPAAQPHHPAKLQPLVHPCTNAWGLIDPKLYETFIQLDDSDKPRPYSPTTSVPEGRVILHFRPLRAGSDEVETQANDGTKTTSKTDKN